MRQTKRKCPQCKHEVDEISSAVDTGKIVAPNPGDITMCLYCGLLEQFTDTTLDRRVLSGDDINALPPKLREQLAWYEIARLQALKNRSQGA